MNKRNLWCGLLLSAMSAFPAVSLAQDVLFNRAAPRGFDAERVSSVSTVAGVYNNAYDGSIVTLRGRLIDFLGHERYKFADTTGSIEVELDDDHNWSYLSKDELICIVGVVDSGFFSTKLDVKQAFSLEKNKESTRIAGELINPDPSGDTAFSSTVSHRDFRN